MPERSLRATVQVSSSKLHDLKGSGGRGEKDAWYFVDLKHYA